MGSLVILQKGHRYLKKESASYSNPSNHEGSIKQTFDQNLPECHIKEDTNIICLWSEVSSTKGCLVIREHWLVSSMFG